MDFSILELGPLMQSKIKIRMANNVDPDEMAGYQPSHLDLHCLCRYWFWSALLKRLRGWYTSRGNAVKIVLPLPLLLGANSYL